MYDIAHSGVSSGIQGKTLIAHGPLGCECSARAPPIELPSIPLAHPLQTTDFFLPLCDDTVLSLTVPSACKALQYILAQLCPCYSHLRSRWPWRECLKSCYLARQLKPWRLSCFCISLLIISFLPSSACSETAEMRSWFLCLVVYPRSMPEHAMSQCSLKKRSDLVSPSCHLCDLGHATLFYVKLHCEIYWLGRLIRCT